MAHLLGSQNCIDSLSKDVSSIQECITTLLQQTGRLEFTSWKYPTKVASSLDVNELLEDYAYCNYDEDSNKLSHIILFELVIDRFCLLIQGVSELFDSVVAVKSPECPTRPASRTVTNTMSVGLVSKLFWNKICEVRLSFEQMEKEVSEYNQSLMKMENVLLELKVENERFRQKKNVKKRNSTEEHGNNNNSIGNIETNDEKQQRHTNTTFTQTYETAFVPCEVCASMQENIIKVGSAVIEICESQGLPSSLSKQKKLLRDSVMTFTDITRWVQEQERDLKKINKYLSGLYKQIIPLQEQLAAEQASNVKLTDEIATTTSERDQLAISTTTLQKLCNETDIKLNSCEQALHLRNDEWGCVTEENKNLNEMNSQLVEDVERYKNSSLALEQGMNSLTCQLAGEEKRIEKLAEIEMELIETQVKLKESEEKVNKLKSENKVLLQHDQRLQTKQANLLSRLEKLDEDVEESQTKLAEYEDEIERLTNGNNEKDEKNKEHKEENQQQSTEIHNLQNQLNNALADIEKEMSLTTANNESEITRLSEQLKLLVCYPVIGRDYQQLEQQYTTIVHDSRNQMESSDGDVINDMESQVKANTARIGILDVQNYSLRQSLVKLEEANADTIFQDNSSKPALESTPRITYVKKLRNSSAPQQTKSTKSNDPLVIPRPPSAPREPSKLSRPWSGGGRNEKKESFNIGAKLANLDRMKSAATVDKFDWNSKETVTHKSAWNAEDADDRNESLICPDCDKTYLSNKDLDIHKNFCYGRLK